MDNDAPTFLHNPIRTLNNTTGRVLIKEIFYIVECSSGTYDINCKETCSVNCNIPQSCDRTTGECIGGCQPGCKGFHCDQSIMAKNFKNTKDLFLVSNYEE